MRLLVGHTNQMPELLLRRPLPGREACGDQILAFGNGYQQVHHEPGMAWNDLLANCPRGWQPEVYLHWSPEYNAVPEGLEAAECLTVGAFGDWNLGGRAIHEVGGVFDVLFADRNGGQRLRWAGFDNVHYAPLWAFDPRLHRRLPDVSRDIDILMIGNFNHEVQQERSRWLARVARLSRRYRIVLTGGLFGEEYVRAMNRAKIVFNRSIRGEINMRAYEAPACGALLFYETENPEIRDLFTDREHCVLYGEDDLEDLLAYYLAPERTEERERIAEAGWRRVQSHAYAHHFAQMLNQIEPLLGQKFARSFRLASPQEQALRRAAQWLTSSDRRVFGRVEAFPFPGRMPSPNPLPLPGGEREGAIPLSSPLSHSVGERGRGSEGETRWGEKACREESEDLNLRSVLQGEWASHLPASPERDRRFAEALALARQALEGEPDYTLACCNLGFLLLAAGCVAEGEAALREAAEQLADREIAPSRLRGVRFPRRFDYFTVAEERIWGEFAPGTQVWREALRSLLLGRIHLTLAENALARNAFRRAADHANEAVSNLPDSGWAQFTQARALRTLGHTDDSLTAYRRALEISPFLMEAWEEAAQLCLDLTRPTEAAALLEEWATLLEACPPYPQARLVCDRMRTQAQIMARQIPATPPTLTRLLAFPDWNDAACWKPLVQAFAHAYRPADPVLLMLRADPEQYPDARALLAALETFLIRELGLAASALPNITLLNQSFAPADRWKLFHVADALVTASGLPADWRDQATAAELPAWTLETYPPARPRGSTAGLP